ncbi:MAG: ketoacyl-ACP synthase III [Desulfobacteraceae bacterium]|nr:ketoacyl-ACP synthase III [Desulfobacteraceae bacterium]
MIKGHIIGTGSALPERILSNQDLEQIIETSDEWIIRRSGIKERRIAKNNGTETTTGLATQAALKALKTANVSPDQIDLIVVATVTGDRLIPSTACLIQKELNANNAAAYDISAGCSGFLYALDIANNSIKTGSSKTVLVIGAERLSSIVNWQDRSTCVLLGDGAGAILLKGGQSTEGILSTHIKSNGHLWDLLYSEDGNKFLPDILHDMELKPFHIKMEGNRLFKKAVSSMARIAKQALANNNLKGEDINWVIPHQANLRIIQAVSEKLEIPMDKFYTNLHKYGNTSAASIPIALDEAYRNGRISKGDRILLVSFGAGLTWGSSLIRWTF